MTQTATAHVTKSASLDALYSLIQQDLKQVDALILSRIKSEVPLIHEIARHIVASGGKRIRPALTLIASKACGFEGNRHIALATAVEFIHTATLLHDDVVDESELRRGLATANEVFGNKASVLVGDFLLSQAFQMMVEDGSNTVLKILSDASAIIAQGEVMQLMTEGDPETTIADYLKVIESKTAALFAAACELGAVAAKKEDLRPALRQFGNDIGIAFQLVDDVLDYSANQQTLGKTVGDDFREGKITLPVIIAYNAGGEEEKDFWNRCLADRDQNAEDLNTAIQYLVEHNALHKAMQMTHEYCNKATQSLDVLPDSPAKQSMLDLVDFCAERVY